MNCNYFTYLHANACTYTYIYICIYMYMYICLWSPDQLERMEDVKLLARVELEVTQGDLT